jgi:undecaprenyl phosphate-alpha-L-ara4FN deformylase
LNEPATKIGLRIDVDTFRGTRLGVPNLVEVMKKHDVRGTFFFSVGPDNMGRNLWRLLRPSFLWKMLRTKAASLYGWDIIFRGTFWPGPIIGKKLAAVIRDTSCAGHEVGLHEWDHYRWQSYLDSMSDDEIRRNINRSVDMLREILGSPPCCSASPAWKTNSSALLAKQQHPFTYNSDCRGNEIFLPIVDGKPLTQPQVPTTLPTYDEIIGRDGITDENYNQRLIELINPAGLNVLTIHAEVEGIVCKEMFAKFIKLCKDRNYKLVPLGELVESSGTLPLRKIIKGSLPGRSGWISLQDSE